MNGRKFPFFIDYLLSNSINSISISAVFTSNTTSLKEKIDIKYKKFLEDAFFIHQEYLIQFKSMKDFYNNWKMKLRLLISPNEFRSCDSFEYLDNGYKLIFLYLYKNIMS